MYFNVLIFFWKIFFNNTIDFLDPISQDEIEQDAPKKILVQKRVLKIKLFL